MSGEHFNIDVIRFIARQLLQTLDFLHVDCKIAHLDIKLENVMLGERNCPIHKPSLLERMVYFLKCQSPPPPNVRSTKVSITRHLILSNFVIRLYVYFYATFILRQLLNPKLVYFLFGISLLWTPSN